jgi:hypothetical protein
VTLAWQESLFDDHPGGDGGLSFSGVRRRALDERCWLDLASGWLPNHGELFDELHESAPWQQRERRMHDKDVLEPRLVTVGLGERRRFLLRPGTSGPPAVPARPEPSSGQAGQVDLRE